MTSVRRLLTLPCVVCAVIATAAAQAQTDDIQLSVTWTAPSKVTLGNPYVFSVNLKNSGTDSSDPTKLDVKLDAPYEGFTGVSPSQGACAFTSPWVRCQLGSLGSNQTASVTVTARAVSGGGANHTIESLGGGVSQADAGFSITFIDPNAPPPPTPADVRVIIHATPKNPTPWSVVTFTSRVVNNGPGTAKKVGFGEVADVGENALSVRTSLGSCTKSTVVRCSLGNLSPGRTATIVVRSCNHGSSLIESVNARSLALIPDPKPSNNTASVRINARRGKTLHRCRDNSPPSP